MCILYQIYNYGKKNEEDILTIVFGHLKFKSQFYRLNKKTRNARNNGFIFSESVKLAAKGKSSLPKLIKSYYIEFRIAIMHRQFLGKFSQIPEYVKTCVMIYIILFNLHAKVLYRKKAHIFTILHKLVMSHNLFA